MIRELEKIEIAACYGGVHLETQTCGVPGAVLGGYASALLFLGACYFAGAFYACDESNMFEGNGLLVATRVFIIIAALPTAMVFGIATYRNLYGETYTIDLDDNTPYC
jgi:hypothetical protein